jgi:ferredoxin
MLSRVVPRISAARRPASFAAASAAMRFHSHELTGDRTKPVNVTFVGADGAEKPATAYVGQTLLEAAAEAGFVIEAACAGSCACSTCHMYLDQHTYDAIPEPSDAEYDMLDLAFMPEPTSRLSCQIKVTEDIAGAKARLPSATRNFAVDGYVATPH